MLSAVPVPSSDACVRSLAQTGVNTIVISEDPTAKTFCSKYCDEAVLTPDPTTDIAGYADALLSLARRDDVRTIVPLREEDAFVLAKRRDAFADHVATPWPTLETLERVTDRVRLREAAEAAGVPVPRTVPIGDVGTVDSRAIVKSRYNLVADEFVDTESPGETSREQTIEHLEPGESPDVAELRAAFGHEPIVQEFIPIKEEYMFAGLYDRGEPVATFQHEQIRGASYTGGGGVYRESVFVPELEEAARRLLEELDWHGLACIEYMRHPETGEFYLAEINPRMWTSLAANVRMGADFPRYYWQLATDRTDEIEAGYERGVGSHYLKGELNYLLSHFRDESSLVDRPNPLRSIREIVESCYRQPQFDVYSRDDPVPFVQDGLRELDERVPIDRSLAEYGLRLGRSEPPVDWREAGEQRRPTTRPR
ncbi:carboxylate--amine ligase [Natrinema marinum]|uniref:carboxylate--amine ligase n=1 Tax=Natrinema marinum TaxID=2961598 RepID=UPI0020C8B7F2|nr:carboxylate--amine ligase [Natrinema marinum]